MNLCQNQNSQNTHQCSGKLSPIKNQPPREETEGLVAALPKQVKNLTGRTFERLTVKSFAGVNKHHNAMWLCVCKCGNDKIVTAGNLSNRSARSCGCLAIEISRKHGESTSREYSIWFSMKMRTTNPSAVGFKHYGGRGIKICDRWLVFENFLFDMGRSPSGMTIERINNSDGYNPKNCRWSTWSDQCRNRRSNVLITFNGITMCALDWSKKLNIGYSNILKKFHMGISPEIIFRSKTNNK